LIAVALVPIVMKALRSYFHWSSRTTLTVTHHGRHVEIVVNPSDEESVRRFLKTVEAPGRES
jgi:hypothetical protein